jgi:hypothetical protein
MSIPTYGSLQNQSNGEYRCNQASKLQGTYSSPDCLINFILQESNSSIYALKNVANNQYYECNIRSMSDSVAGACQQWRLLWIEGDQYYVQNVQNNEFMTSSAGSLSSSAGPNEIWIIVAQNN